MVLMPLRSQSKVQSLLTRPRYKSFWKSTLFHFKMRGNVSFHFFGKFCLDPVVCTISQTVFKNRLINSMMYYWKKLCERILVRMWIVCD